MSEKKTEAAVGLTGLLGAIGGTLLAHHKSEYGRWWDNENKCQGKIGAAMLLSSILGILGMSFKGDNK
ncbi:hypothetical protein AKJ51_00395 [candidate division MSBL1 archaeon SCGC-AAA382A20]|uniref:Uncharacterized protein n=1 Tax=candidate division MSBL1 archaeon SCGC-AAA382A20 TaxID=1698280 RepID=A0A133VMP0_9EURY|nr:hypothetical protein AKJ51_00395 [candidate division MSBL1 archaeon SCGC-AAA382A20]